MERALGVRLSLVEPCTPLRACWVSGEVAWALWGETRDHRTRSLVQESLVLFSSKADRYLVRAAPKLQSLSALFMALKPC